LPWHWLTSIIIVASSSSRSVKTYAIVRESASAWSGSPVDVVYTNILTGGTSDVISSWTSIVRMPVIDVDIINDRRPMNNSIVSAGIISRKATVVNVTLWNKAPPEIRDAKTANTNIYTYAHTWS
jgi:hypothetical protein